MTQGHGLLAHWLLLGYFEGVLEGGLRGLHGLRAGDGATGVARVRLLMVSTYNIWPLRLRIIHTF